MATTLTSRILDIKITKITPKTVTYELHATGKTEQWKIPTGSTFNTSVLVVGQRYTVNSQVIYVQIKSRLTKKLVRTGRYDWVGATLRPQRARLVAQTAKQRKAREALDAMPLVDTAGLFAW